MKKIITTIMLFTLVGCASHPIPDPYTLKIQEKGDYSNIPLATKDFIIKGVVTLESVVKINSYGNKEGSEITNIMLIKEAKKLGADDIVNVRIDKTENVDYKSVADNYGSIKTVKVKEIIYRAVGIAIKYK